MKKKIEKNTLGNNERKNYKINITKKWNYYGCKVKEIFVSIK